MVGDRLAETDGEIGTVKAVEVVYTAQPMFNLTLAEAHTYFVGDGGWLVHNCGPGVVPYSEVNGHHVHQKALFMGLTPHSSREFMTTQ